MTLTTLWLAGPPLAAALLASVLRRRFRVVLILGVVLAAAFVVVVYLRAPHDYAHSQGDEDGEMFLGRWWEPTFIAFVVLVGYALWAIGAGLGFVIGSRFGRAD
jgi:predicted outer membrane lipoprotein